MRRWPLLIALGAVWACGATEVAPGPNAPLSLEKTIPLPGVSGRIDHLAFDARSQRLFVAEIANGTVDVIDIRSGVRSTLSGFRGPQGLGWIERTHELAVASSDGSVKFFAENTLKPTASIAIGDDADDLRVDPATRNVVVGYGSGGLATIDPAGHRLVSRLALPAHPEGFSLDGNLAYINLPDAGRVVLADRRTNQVEASWRTGLRRLNFPMAYEPSAKLLAVGFRFPATVALMDGSSGEVRQSIPTCGDTDDLYFDPPRERLYVICGSGKVDVFRRTGTSYTLEARVISLPGARTGLFAPEIDRLFVAAPARGADAAAILVYRTVAPAPDAHGR